MGVCSIFVDFATPLLKGHVLIATVFWLTTVCIFYTYAGYPVLLMLLACARQLRSDWQQLASGGNRRVQATPQLPSVAVLVAAYNEERHIAERVRNLLAQNYPADRLTIYIGSDASSDTTAQILAEFTTARLHFTDFPERRGKPSVVNDLAAAATEDVLVFTDANTFFKPDTVEKLVRHLANPDVGCVCGELRLVSEAGDNQDHIYWRYERLLKFFESRIGALLGANGGVYALRRADYEAIPPDTIVDDFWVSMQVVEAGKRCVYDPEAVATEVTPERMADEFKRRVRIGKGNYQALGRFAGLLHPRHGWLAFAFLSHKVLRWLVPHCMVLSLVCNVLLAAQNGSYGGLLLLQVVFYASAAVGWYSSRHGTTPRALRLPLFFVSMNWGLLMGFWQFVRGGSSGVWARSAR
jgi:cellulose synthase/poly-beta-1,6-N-acetylglucosamine synthase-like glycosyltransferase